MNWSRGFKAVAATLAIFMAAATVAGIIFLVIEGLLALGVSPDAAFLLLFGLLILGVVFLSAAWPDDE